MKNTVVRNIMEICSCVNKQLQEVSLVNSCFQGWDTANVHEPKIWANQAGQSACKSEKWICLPKNSMLGECATDFIELNIMNLFRFDARILLCVYPMTVQWLHRCRLKLPAFLASLLYQTNFKFCPLGFHLIFTSTCKPPY